MVDLEGNVGETISRYHDHFNESLRELMCIVCDVRLTTLMSLTAGAGHVRGGALFGQDERVEHLTVLLTYDEIEMYRSIVRLPFWLSQRKPLARRWQPQTKRS
jgi:hypothetical protein